MLTKGAIGNLVNRYKAVLKKCNLINTFGSLAVASMLVLSGAGVAEAAITSDDNGFVSESTQATILRTYSSGVRVESNPNYPDYQNYYLPNDKNITIISDNYLSFEDTVKIVTTGDVSLTGCRITDFGEDDKISGKDVTLELIDNSALGGGSISASDTLTFINNGTFLDTSLSADKIDVQVNLTVNGNSNVTASTMDAIGEGSLNFKGNSIISVDSINLLHTMSVYDNAKFTNNVINTINFVGEDNVANAPRIENFSNNTVKINTLNIEKSTGTSGEIKEAILANKALDIDGKNVFEIGNVNIGDEAILSVYSHHNGGFAAEDAPVQFDNVDMGADSELRLGWRDDDYAGSLTQKNIGTITLAEGAKVVAIDEASDTAPSDDLKGTGSANIQNIIFEGNDAAIKATVKGNSTNVTVADGVTGASINKIDTNQANVDIENPENSSLGIKEVVENTNVDITTGTEHNTGNAQSDLQKLADAVDITTNNGSVTASIGETDIYGAASATLNKEGKLDTSTIKQARNTLMDAALQQASITTVSLDRILTNDVRKRLGDIRSDANTTGVWMRWDGGKLQGDGLTNNFNTIQIGGDTKVAKNCRLGVAGSFTHGDTDFARGNGELEGFSFAAYATWMGENGMFADIVARLGSFSTEMNVEGRTGDMDNRVASLSAEYGWRLPICDQFFIEPQVEFAYTYVSSEDLQLGETKYQFDSVDSLTGRAGIVAGWNLPDNRGNVYARASVVQQFMGDAKISGVDGNGGHNVQEIDGDDTWLEYGIGANVKLTDNTYIWADVERTEGAEIDEEWRGTVGVRYSF